MDREEQLSWEARVGRQVGIAAIASAILQFAALIFGSAAIKPKKVGGVTTSTVDRVDSLRVASEHHAAFIGTTVLQALGILLLVPVLWYLYETSRFRRDETPRYARHFALIAPPLMAIMSVIGQFAYLHVADRVTDHLEANSAFPKAANDYATAQLNSTGAIQILGYATAVALGLALVVVALHAMRAGLLSRFMGILGIVVGALFALPILGQIPFVEIFWIGALGFLFLDRWPQGGRGPAWASGAAIPWPTAQDRAAAMAAERAEREIADDDEPEPARETVPPDLDEHVVAREHPRSKKRKRKRR